MAFVEREHLGGYVVGGDEATYFPDLWYWLIDDCGVFSVIDVGCGEGLSLKYFRDEGCDVLGIEGVPQDDPDILTHDYTTGPAPVQARFDLCWSCEFVEHVEEQYVPNFLSTFALADVVLMTHAWPTQAGYHHVNCQTAEYWIGAMAGIGFHLDQDLTARTRELSRRNPSAWNHYQRSGLAFLQYS